MEQKRIVRGKEKVIGIGTSAQQYSEAAA